MFNGSHTYRYKYHDGESGQIFGIISLAFALFGFVSLGALASIIYPIIPVPSRERVWSLQIGSPGIRITRGTDKHEYGWEKIQTYTVAEFAGRSVRGIGLFAKFPESLVKASGDEEKLDPHLEVDESTKSVTYRPAGLRIGGPVKVSNGMVPLCVLGPMTDQQKAALRAALARYAPGKNDAEAWGQ